MPAEAAGGHDPQPGTPFVGHLTGGPGASRPGVLVSTAFVFPAEGEGAGCGGFP